MKTITIDIAEDSSMEVSTEGYKGDTCLTAIDNLRKTMKSEGLEFSAESIKMRSDPTEKKPKLKVKKGDLLRR